MGVADLGGIDDVIHGRMRLGIMVYLADADAADFTELKTVLEATQGNLSVHLKKLEEAGYVAIAKSFVNNKPLTRVSITPEGRRAFADYLEAIGALIGGRGAHASRPPRSRQAGSNGSGSSTSTGVSLRTAPDGSGHRMLWPSGRPISPAPTWDRAEIRPASMSAACGSTILTRRRSVARPSL